MLDALNLNPTRPYPPCLADCPVCEEPILSVYHVNSSDGGWAYCPKCHFRGDCLSLCEISWEVEPDEAIGRLRELGMIPDAPAAWVSEALREREDLWKIRQEVQKWRDEVCGPVGGVASDFDLVPGWSFSWQTGMPLPHGVAMAAPPSGTTCIFMESSPGIATALKVGKRVIPLTSRAASISFTDGWDDSLSKKWGPNRWLFSDFNLAHRIRTLNSRIDSSPPPLIAADIRMPIPDFLANRVSKAPTILVAPALTSRVIFWASRLDASIIIGDVAVDDPFTAPSALRDAAKTASPWRNKLWMHMSHQPGTPGLTDFYEQCQLPPPSQVFAHIPEIDRLKITWKMTRVPSKRTAFWAGVWYVETNGIWRRAAGRYPVTDCVICVDEVVAITRPAGKHRLALYCRVIRNGAEYRVKALTSNPDFDFSRALNAAMVSAGYPTPFVTKSIEPVLFRLAVAFREPTYRDSSSSYGWDVVRRELRVPGMTLTRSGPVVPIDAAAGRKSNISLDWPIEGTDHSLDARKILAAPESGRSMWSILLWAVGAIIGPAWRGRRHRLLFDSIYFNYVQHVASQIGLPRGGVDATIIPNQVWPVFQTGAATSTRPIDRASSDILVLTPATNTAMIYSMVDRGCAVLRLNADSVYYDDLTVELRRTFAAILDFAARGGVENSPPQEFGNAVLSRAQTLMQQFFLKKCPDLQHDVAALAASGICFRSIDQMDLLGRYIGNLMCDDRDGFSASSMISRDKKTGTVILSMDTIYRVLKRAKWATIPADNIISLMRSSPDIKEKATNRGLAWSIPEVLWETWHPETPVLTEEISGDSYVDPSPEDMR